GIDRGLAGTSPDQREKLGQLAQVVELGQLLDPQFHYERGRSRCVLIPASLRARRTAAATAGAPGVSPWTQIVSKRSERASRIACSAASVAESTAPGWLR